VSGNNNDNNIHLTYAFLKTFVDSNLSNNQIRHVKGKRVCLKLVKGFFLKISLGKSKLMILQT